MKKILSPAALLLTSGLTAVGSVHAATATSTLDVSALVGQACTVSTSPVNFGNVFDPTLGAQTTGSITATCTPGMSYSIALNGGKYYNGQRNISDGKGNYMAYDLLSPLLWGTWGDGIMIGPSLFVPFSNGTDVFTVDGILFSNWVPSGYYSDTVDVTVTY